MCSIFSFGCIIYYYEVYIFSQFMMMRRIFSVKCIIYYVYIFNHRQDGCIPYFVVVSGSIGPQFCGVNGISTCMIIFIFFFFSFNVLFIKLFIFIWSLKTTCQLTMNLYAPVLDMLQVALVCS